MAIELFRVSARTDCLETFDRSAIFQNFPILSRFFYLSFPFRLTPGRLTGIGNEKIKLIFRIYLDGTGNGG